MYSINSTMHLDFHLAILENHYKVLFLLTTSNKSADFHGNLVEVLWLVPDLNGN